MQINIRFFFLNDVLTEIADFSKTGVGNLGTQAKCGWRVFNATRVWLGGSKANNSSCDKNLLSQQQVLNQKCLTCGPPPILIFFDIFSNL